MTFKYSIDITNPDFPKHNTIKYTNDFASIGNFVFTLSMKGDTVVVRDAYDKVIWSIFVTEGD